jgi:hypothetical protein
LAILFLFFSSRSLDLQRVSREEFRKGCDLINNSLPADSDQRLTNIDHTLDLMDFDGTGDIDINEFFEVSGLQRKQTDAFLPTPNIHFHDVLYFDLIHNLLNYIISIITLINIFVTD